MKWEDKNGNGVKDAGESGLPNWTIQLRDPNTNTVIQTVSTDSSGNYCFTVPAPGSYKLTEVAPIVVPPWVQTFPLNPNFYTVTVSPGQVVTGRNFGNRRGIVFPDFVVRNLTVIPPGIPGGPVPLGSPVVVRFDIVNQGTGDAGPASHEVRLFIPGGPGGADVNVLLATVMTGPLAAGASQSFTQIVTIPREVPTGLARIRIIGDAPNRVSESDEGNNTAEFPVTLTRPPGP
jgi:hypothetical protein